MSTVYVVVMDDNESDTPVATVELTTFHKGEAEERAASLRDYYGSDADEFSPGILVTVTPMHLEV